MRTTYFWAVASIALAVGVDASPLRMVLVAGSNLPNVRFGHPVAAIQDRAPVATLARSTEGTRRRACMSARFRAKAVEMSNTLRQALGLPLIQAGPHNMPGHHEGHEGGMYHIMPFIGTPPTFVEVKDNGEGMTRGGDVIKIATINEHFHRMQHHHHEHKERLRALHRAPFMKRIHFALMALGPWEGRAVAFVLGCGIGVLLRMIWVLAVVTYRTIRGTKEDENKYTQIVVVEEYEDSDEPPSYASPDDKPIDDVKVPIVPRQEAN